MQKGFLGSSGGGGNHKRKDGSKAGNDSISQPAKLDDNLVFPSIDHTTRAAGFPSLEATNGKLTDGRTELDKISSLDLDKPGIASLGINSGSVSFATLLKGESSRKKVNFRTLHAPTGNGADVVISKKSVSIVNKRFCNSVYGFFLGKQVPFPVVENYVKNTWSKYGLVRSMMTNGMFFFKFSSNDGMNSMLENGPWLIRNVPIILKKWSPDANIMKEDVCNVPVWVKFHDIPITAFTEDGLSVIATKLGTPLMLDSYTTDMCLESWGRLSFARAMIELRADVELKDTLVVDIPKFEGEGYTRSTIRVEYEWKPPRCSTCKVFGHVLDDCHKKIVSNVSKNLKMPRQAARGPPVGLKPKSNFVYRPVQPNNKTSGQTNSASTSSNKKQAGLSRQEVSNSNPFDALNSVENNDDLGINGGISKLAEKRADSVMDSSAHGSSHVTSSSLKTTPLAERINKLERQMLDGKLMLVDDDGKPLNKVDSVPVNSDSESDVEVAYDETARFMASGGANDGSLYEDEDYDIYDTYDIEGLTKKELEFCDMMDINLRGRSRR